MFGSQVSPGQKRDYLQISQYREIRIQWILEYWFAGI